MSRLASPKRAQQQKQQQQREKKTQERDLSPKRSVRASKPASQQWMMTYLMQALKCDSPILEAYWLHTPEMRLRRIQYRCMEILEPWASVILLTPRECFDDGRPSESNAYRRSGFHFGLSYFHPNFGNSTLELNCSTDISLSTVRVSLHGGIGPFISRMFPWSLSRGESWDCMEAWLRHCFVLIEHHEPADDHQHIFAGQQRLTAELELQGRTIKY